jgi:uncharacterized heparinase superfamily protein
MKKIFLYWHTVKLLRWRQIFYRIYYTLLKKTVSVEVKQNDIVLRKPKHSIFPFIAKKKTYFLDDSVSFLNHQVPFTSSLWNDSRQEKLWLYNLHYFDALNSDSTEQARQAYQLLENWISDNPPFSGNGWESYPISLRIVNIVKFALTGTDLSEHVLASLFLQARYLYCHCEYHILGNHLFENYKALCFAGLFFEGDEPNKWFRKGVKGLEEETNEQVLDDGGHFELSPMYHVIILEGLLDLKNLFSAYNKTVFWDEVVKKMLGWLELMMRSEEEISYFNDSSNNMASTPKEIFQYATDLGLGFKQPEKKSVLLKESGYAILQNKTAKVICDVAEVGPSYLPGHAHADTLSFECYIDEQPLFVNLGTSCYGNSTQRNIERSTRSHNTVEINDENSSEIWGSFRVARRAKPIVLKFSKGDESVLMASHDGYERFEQGCEHKRTWVLNDRSLVVSDVVDSGVNKAYFYLHFHPSCAIIKQEDRSLIIRLINGDEVSIVASFDFVMVKSQYTETFGKLIESISLVGQLSFGIENKIVVNWSA